MTEQAQEKVTPDSQKSTMDKASENVSGVGDKIAGSAQPRKNFDSLSLLFAYANSVVEDQKSYTQQAADSTRSNADSGQNQGQSILQQGQEMVGNAAQSVADTLSGNTSK